MAADVFSINVSMTRPRISRRVRRQICAFDTFWIMCETWARHLTATMVCFASRLCIVSIVSISPSKRFDFWFLKLKGYLSIYYWQPLCFSAYKVYAPINPSACITTITWFVRLDGWTSMSWHQRRKPAAISVYVYHRGFISTFLVILLRNVTTLSTRLR